MNHSDVMIQTLSAAMAASAEGDFEGALALYRQASAEDPASATPHFLRAAELAQAQHYGDAEAAYAIAVLLDGDLYIARFELGVLQFTSGRASVALLTWEPLMHLPDDHALKLFVQGYAQLAQDQFDSAQALFRRGMAANSQNPALNRNIAMLLLAIDAAVPPIKADMEPLESVVPEALSSTGSAGPSDGEVQRYLSSYQRGQGPLH